MLIRRDFGGAGWRLLVHGWPAHGVVHRRGRGHVGAALHVGHVVVFGPVGVVLRGARVRVARVSTRELAAGEEPL